MHVYLSFSCLLWNSCNVLNDAPFNACHDNTDPAPFIAACKNTLCIYPDVNGLYCQFLAAYARTCNLHSDILDDWWEDVSCCKTSCTLLWLRQKGYPMLTYTFCSAKTSFKWFCCSQNYVFFCCNSHYLDITCLSLSPPSGLVSGPDLW